jgi:hypothetical protein
MEAIFETDPVFLNAALFGQVCARHYHLPWGDRPAEFAATPSQEG